MMQVCWSNGKYVTSIVQEDCKKGQVNNDDKDCGKGYFGDEIVDENNLVNGWRNPQNFTIWVDENI